jgi:uncharacterized repeat protein (TIGR01451 family)
MKKRILGTILCFLTLALFAPAAHAEEMKVNVTASPSELSDTGTVTFTFEIANYSVYEMSDVVINILGTDHPVPLDQPIPPNGSALGINITVTVPESQLGTPIPITVTSVRSGEPIVQTLEALVNRAADPVITVTRTADKQTGKEGDVVTLTYKLANETKFDMTNISVIDENVSDSVIISQPLLRASQSISIESKYVLGTDSVVSAPIVTYTVNGKTKTFSAIDPLTLTVVLVKLNLNVDMGTPTAEGVTFTLEVKNTGNQDISNITVTDDKGTAVNASPFSLKTGETNTISYQVVPLMTEALRQVKFNLKGTDALGGEYTLASTGSYEVYPYVDDSQISVTMTAQTITPWDEKTGKINGRILITNHSLVELKNIQIYESGNSIKTYDTLQPGETTFDQEFSLGSPRNLSFTLKGTDPTGSLRELGTCTLQVGYAQETETGAATPIPQTSTNNTQAFSFLSTTISKILLGLGILMVLSFITLLVLSILERSKSGGALIRFDEEEDEDSLDDLFEPEPVDEWKQREEELSYTQRIRAQQERRNGYTARNARPYETQQQVRYPSEPVVPASTVKAPPAQQGAVRPTVRYEYDDASTAREQGRYPGGGADFAPGDMEAGPLSVQPPFIRLEAGQQASETYLGEEAYEAPAQPVFQPEPVMPDYSAAVGKRESLYGRVEAVPVQTRGGGVSPKQAPYREPEAAPPKVLHTKPTPSTIPASRNQVRHVRKAEDEKKDR